MADKIVWIPALIVLVGTLVFFHELGHFSMAKLLKIRVQEFAFGFGPKWIRLFKRGDTEYTIHPVPLGGFVKLAGMEPGEEDVPDGFQSKPVWSRFLVYLAGPLMSLVLAYMVFSSQGFTFGLPTGESENRVDLVAPNSRAERAGLNTGDVIVRINDERIESGEEMVAYIHNSLGKPLVIIVNRDGRLVRIYATPGPAKLDGKTVGLLGFTVAQKLERVGLVESVRFGNDSMSAFIRMIFTVLTSRQIKDAVGGPLAIADATLTSVKRGPYGFLQLMGVWSLFLGIINLLPIPVLDGGQIMLLAGEAVRRRRLSPRTIEIAMRVGLTIIALIFITMMYLDLSRIAANKLFR